MTMTGAEALIQVTRESTLTDEVVASFGGSEDPRFREVMSSLVRHLHGFIRDVRLTQVEWDAAIGFLTRAGQTTDEHRQEFILLSDVLGASMMTVAVNAPARSTATESTVFGPFFVENAPFIENGDDIGDGMSGHPCYVHGSVRSATGAALAGVRLEVWAADDDGFYDVQHESRQLSGRAHFFTNEDGTFDYWTVQPAAYPIPHDGPVGDLLDAARRSPMRPAHIHFMVSHPGYETLITHIFVEGDEWLEKDAVFGVKPSLIVPFVEHEPGAGPPGRNLAEKWTSAQFDITLAPIAEPQRAV
ncbi:dioxygenase [Arthrobacter sp. 2RAF6]|uniref:dioxygenase family protein n=1 Tax=Arthrobacter sp. 2RAF6 TaxID=3233002 RepID=UPI003F92E882